MKYVWTFLAGVVVCFIGLMIVGYESMDSSQERASKHHTAGAKCVAAAMAEDQAEAREAFLSAKSPKDREKVAKSAKWVSYPSRTDREDRPVFDAACARDAYAVLK